MLGVRVGERLMYSLHGASSVLARTLRFAPRTSHAAALRFVQLQGPASQPVRCKDTGREKGPGVRKSISPPAHREANCPRPVLLCRA